MVGGVPQVISKEYLIAFSLIILFFIWCRRELSLTSIRLSLRISWNLRKQIISQVLDSNYRQLSARIMGIRAAILSDVNALTNASLGIINFSIAVIMSISCFVYLATISLSLFAITLVVSAAGIAVYYFSSKANTDSLQKTRRLENEFQSSLNDVLHGFKEIYMDPKKGKYIFENKICTTAAESYSHNLEALTGFNNNQVIGQLLFYVLITAVLLIFSVLLKITVASIVSYTFTLLYLLGSIETIMVQLPVLMRAGVAADQLSKLKSELESYKISNPVPERSMSKDLFECLEINDLQFGYAGGDGDFTIRPSSMTINKGDLIFIYGGNGSGKTTFIYSILGLLPPTGGEIKLNGNVVTPRDYPVYKSLFSIVFSDFYLFDEIPGEFHGNLEKWQHYIRLFELEDKVSMEGRRFTTTKLSTGQRKRLALIAALMEDKPILIIDEWAADQDPYFRRKFYTEVLPILHENGTTILAITHDDKYYHCADKLFKMEEGRLTPETPEPHKTTLFTI